MDLFHLMTFVCIVASALGDNDDTPNIYVPPVPSFHRCARQHEGSTKYFKELNKAYLIIKNNTNFAGCKKECNRCDGTLAKITDKNEWNQIALLARDSGAREWNGSVVGGWIGLHSHDNSTWHYYEQDPNKNVVSKNLWLNKDDSLKEGKECVLMQFAYGCPNRGFLAYDCEATGASRGCFCEIHHTTVEEAVDKSKKEKNHPPLFVRGGTQLFRNSGMLSGYNA